MVPVHAAPHAVGLLMLILHLVPRGPGQGGAQPLCLMQRDILTWNAEVSASKHTSLHSPPL